jgi:hypothetical protein
MFIGGVALNVIGDPSRVEGDASAAEQLQN